jgi:hypothetical protein
LDEKLTDSRASSTVDERIALVWQLTLEGWAVRHDSLPTYERSAMPGRLVRPEP